MAVPSGIGLSLSMKSTGNLRTAGVVVNGIALGISLVAIFSVVMLMLVYGGVMALSLSQQPNQGGGF